MAIFEFKAGVTTEIRNQALLKAALGDFTELDRLLGKGGQKVDYKLNINVSGTPEITKAEEVTRQLSKGQKEARVAIAAMTRAQEGSLTSLRQSVNALKQQRDSLNSTSAEWASYAQRVKAAQASLSAASGIQAGSLTDLRNQREELKKLRDATTRFPSGPTGAGGGPTWNDLNKQIGALDGQINAVTPGFSRFFNVLSRVATVQAGFVALTSAFAAVGGAVNSYVSRTKQIEAFGLALKNVGLTQAGTTAAFKEATAIANRLGAPVQQVEKSYQRMVPALKAAGASSQKTGKFIENITARTQTLGLNTEESGRLFEAFAQVLSKGKLQAEELNQQISELDGAFRTQLADAIGVNVEQLTELVSAGKITAPVFIEAVNSMANGVEELQKRIKNGTATIQQLQNQIGNISVATLTQVGAAIEPGIKSFLKLSNAVATFFLEFSKTELFKTFIIIFNQSAKGIETFVSGLLKVLSVLSKILTPIASAINLILGFGESFGGVIGLAITLGGTLLVLKGAIAGLAVLTAATASLRAFGAAMATAGGAQSKLVNPGTAGALGGLRQGVENTRAAIVGMGRSLATSAASFVGFKSAVTSAGQGISTASAAASKAPSTFRAFSQAATQATAATASLGNTAGQTSTRYAQFRAEVLRLNPGLKLGGQAAAGAAQGIGALGSAALNAGSKIATGLKNVLKEIINPITILIIAIGALGQTFTAEADAAKAVREGYTGVFEPLNEELARVAANSKKASAATQKSSSSLAESIPAVQKSAQAAKNLGEMNRFAAIALFAGAAALVIFTGGLGAVALAAGATALAVKASSDAAKQLGESATGKQILKSSKEFETKLGSITARIRDLGGKAGQVDFSSFKEGSKNLSELGFAYRASAASLKQKIEADKEAIKAEKAKEAPDQANIKFLEAEIELNGTRLKQAEESAAAVSAETAARIAFGKAVDVATVSVEELTAAEKLSNEIIDIASIEAKTRALQEYGQVQSDQGKLEAASLGIEAAASSQRLALAQKQLSILDQKKAKQGSLDAEQKQSVIDLTKTVVTENQKQVELQKQLGEAVVAAFEKGVAKVRELANVYGQVSQGLKTGFDGLTAGVSSGLQASVGLINAVIETESQGLDENSAQRKALVLEGLRAQAQANQVEYQIASFKLEIQNRIAQNEARVAQLRLEAEAKIAAARGDTEIAGALQEAASVQGQVISGLQKQFEIEKQVLAINKAQQDQALINKGIQEAGAGATANSVAQSLGVQRTSLAEAKAGLQTLIGTAKGLSTELGNSAAEASDMKTNIEKTQIDKGSEEAKTVATAYKEGADSVKILDQEMKSTADSVQVFLKGMNEAKTASAGIASDLAKVAGILGGSGTPARALGGPVSAGHQYKVNDGGGREAFLSKTGRLSMLPAGRNLNWVAPTTGTIIPANFLDQYRKNSWANDLIGNNNQNITANNTRSNTASASVNSGNLAQRVASAVSGSSTTQRITNNVTIQSQEPVTDASKIMTNVARMRLRNSRRI